MIEYDIVTIKRDIASHLKQLRKAAIYINKEYTKLLMVNNRAIKYLANSAIADNVARIVTDSILSHPGFRNAIIKELNLRSELTQITKAIEAENGK